MSQDIIKKAIAILKTEIAESSLPYDAITNQNAAKDLLSLMYGAKKIEYFGALLLNNSNKIIKIAEYGKGTESRCNVYIKDIAFDCMKHKANGIILFHNHPSGNKIFSSADYCFHENISSCFKTLEIRVLDHILIVADNCISIKDQL